MDLLKFWDSIIYAKTRKSLLKDGSNVILIRVFEGGKNSIQLGPFSQAIASLPSTAPKFTVESCNTDEVKRQKLTAQDLVEWLLESDIHFILSHVHQGLEPLGWNMQELGQQLGRLYYHQGFPNGKNLSCPVFLQDKYEYLSLLPDITNPTLKVPINDDKENTMEVLKDIESFTKENNEGMGWVVKAPYTTNGSFMKFAKAKSNILSVIKMARRKYGTTIPYLMVQPRMVNRKEYKLAFCRGKFRYICSILPDKGGKSFSVHPHKELIAFAKKAMQDLRNACPHVICDSLFRIDIFQNKDQKYIVNEFESLEAGFYCAQQNKFYYVSSKLVKFWKEIILRCLSNITDTK